MSIPTLDARQINDDKALLRSTATVTGAKLNNGATLLIETEPIRFPAEVVTTLVLAVAEGGYQPFVVWTRCRDYAQSGKPSEPRRIVDYCINGNYFRELEDALWAFNEQRTSGDSRAEQLRQPTIAQQHKELNELLAREK